MPLRRLIVAAPVAFAAAWLGLSGCAAGPQIQLPPVGGIPDYQLGEAYTPAPGITIVVRDPSEQPAGLGYDICYLNGFQTQPDESSTWPADLLLSDSSGDHITDSNWPDETLLDTSTLAKRTAIAEHLGTEIEACANAGFDAVEFDNLDSYSRSYGLISVEDNIELAKLLVASAHSRNLAVAQKNTAQWSLRLRTEAGFDFAIAEECARFGECPAYTEVYGDAVIDIEYGDSLERPFQEMCEDAGSPDFMILRDRNLVSPESSDYQFANCSSASK